MMQTIRHLALGGCILCAGAGMIRLFWPENAFKPVINLVLLLYIITSVVRVGAAADWPAFAAELRAFSAQGSAQQPSTFECYRQDIALLASAQALQALLEQNGIGCSFVLQDGVCRITLADPARQSEASELLEKNSGTLPWELTAEGGETP